MKRLVLILLLAAACSKSEQRMIDDAQAGCRGRYDNIQRWVSVRARAPESEEELNEAARNDEKDPWGNAYVIEEIDGKIMVWCAGPDGQLGTEDDISYPPTE